MGAFSHCGVDEMEASQIFEALDLSNKGRVSYSDFLASMCVSDKLLSEQRLDEVFHCLDGDRSGLITAEGLRELSKSCESLSTCANSLEPTASLNSADFAAQLRSAVGVWKPCESVSTCANSSPTVSLNSADFAAQLRSTASSQALQEI